MDLVERYVYAVVKHLPAKNRKDIEKELRSLIMDALDEKTQGNKPKEEDIIAVLKEFGAPSAMAENYYKEGCYVIGPRFYGLYVLILKISLTIAAIALVIGFIVESVEKGDAVLNLFYFVGQAASAFFGTIGVITVAFALSERVNAVSDKDGQNSLDTWEPRELPAVPKPSETIKISELIVGLFFTILFFIILNFYPRTLGFYFNERQEFITLIQLDALTEYITIINVLIGLSFLKLVLLLVDGKYKAYTFALEIAGALGLIGLAVMMLTGPALVDVSRLTDLQLQETLSDLIYRAYRSVLVAIILLGVFELGRYGYRFARSLGKMDSAG